MLRLMTDAPALRSLSSVETVSVSLTSYCLCMTKADDRAGPEIVEQAVRVLKVVSEKTGLKLELTEKDFGGIAIDNHGNPLPDDTLKTCKESDAVLFGAIGGPKWGVGPVRPEQGILKLRKELGLYANIRPANFISDALLDYSPIKAERVKGTDIIVVRELIGGICESSSFLASYVVCLS